jgi:PKD repeat protein
VWLNLDMNTGFPGGKTTGAQKRVLALRENVSKGAVLPANEPPIPKILFEPMIPDVNETVRFDGGSQSIDDGGIRDYIWTFGDQKPNKKGPKVDHEYAKAEVYRVTLKVVDYLGLSNSTYIDLRVNSPPIADFEYKQSGESELQFVSNSTDADGRIVEYNWDFGDGDSSKKPSPKHPYEGKGPFEVSLSVKDDAGSVAVITRTVKINQPPVVAIDYSPKMPGVGTKITFTGIADDPDGSVKSVFFDFGDGETSDIRTPIHQFKSGGAKTITFSAKDDNDAVNSTSIDIYVNIPPQASFTFSPDNPNVGDFVTFDAGSSYDTEPGNLRYTWDFGDDTPPLTKNTTTARHKFEEANIFTVSLKVTDEWGDESEAAKKVTVGTKPTGATPAEMPSVGYATAPSPNETVPAVAAESAWAMPKPLNRPPSIDTMRHDPEYPYVANIVTFTASYSDPDGQVVRLLWDFGDGSFDIITPAINTGGTRIEHTYGGVGNYVVNLTATDNNGASDFRSELITIIPTPSGYNSTSMQPSTTIASPAEVTIQEYPPMRPVPAEACENCTSVSS